MKMAIELLEEAFNSLQDPDYGYDENERISVLIRYALKELKQENDPEKEEMSIRDKIALKAIFSMLTEYKEEATCRMIVRNSFALANEVICQMKAGNNAS
jgi:ATP-dependent Lon protease